MTKCSITRSYSIVAHLLFKENAKLSSTVAELFYIPTTIYEHVFMALVMQVLDCRQLHG